jgi:hypothetical protein
MTRVSLDIMTIEQTTSRRPHVLVILDEYTKYAAALPLTNQEATTIGNQFFDKWVLQYGVPNELLSDRGSNFLSDFFLTLLDRLKITKITTAAYHPQGNGANERLHRTLYAILRSLVYDYGQNWEHYLQLALFAYHTTYHKSLGTTPHMALMGYKIPNFALQTDEYAFYDPRHIPDHPIDQRLKDLQGIRQQIYQKLWQRQKQVLDSANKKTKHYTFRPGDLVVIRNHVRSKMTPYWDGPAKIISKKTDVTYEVEFLDDESTRRHNIIHVSHLRPWSD